MSNRLVRINELVQRELNSYLRKRYQSEAAAITITSVEIADDLKTGKAHVAIFGKEDYVAGRMDWLLKHAGELRRDGDDVDRRRLVVRTGGTLGGEALRVRAGAARSAPRAAGRTADPAAAAEDRAHVVLLSS